MNVNAWLSIEVASEGLVKSKREARLMVSRQRKARPRTPALCDSADERPPASIRLITSRPIDKPPKQRIRCPPTLRSSWLPNFAGVPTTESRFLARTVSPSTHLAKQLKLRPISFRLDNFPLLHKTLHSRQKGETNGLYHGLVSRNSATIAKGRSLI